MEQNNSSSVISLVDLFAYCIRKFFVLMICALIGAAVLLAYHIGISNTQKKKDAYNDTVASYNSNLVMVEQNLSNLKAKQSFIDDIFEKNPMFGNNDVYCASAIFSVDTQKGVTITDTGSIVSAIGSEIQTIWNTLDVAKLIGSELDAEFFKTSFVYTNNGLMHQIDVYSGSEEQAYEYAKIVLDYLVEFVDGHDGDKVTFKSVETSKASKENLNAITADYLEEKSEIVSDISENEELLKSLKENPPSRYHFLRFFVLGFLAGGFVSVLLLAIGFVSNNPITSTFNSEKIISVPFLGAFFVDKTVFSKIARSIIGERKFKDDSEEEAYVKSNIERKVFCSEGVSSIAVISSIDSREVSIAGEKTCQILKECGYNAVLIKDSVKNPILAEALDSTDAVILLEQQWNSKTQLVKLNEKHVTDNGKKLLGFIIC